MDTNIQSSVQELSQFFSTKYPYFRPPVFLQCFYPTSIQDLFSQSCEVDSHLQQWLDQINPAGKKFSFTTEIVYDSKEIKIVGFTLLEDNDEMLSSIPQMVKLLTLGEGMEIQYFADRFLQLNHHHGGLRVHRNKVVEAYNIAYTLQVLISNIPGMRITLAGHTVPIHSSDFSFISSLLSTLLPKKKLENKKLEGTIKKEPSRGNNKQKQDFEEIDDNEQEEVNLEVEGKKKKRRKRGKAGIII